MCFKEDVQLLILPSDNLILSKDLLFKSIDNALNLNQNSIILFGSKPTFPSTAYGYIIQEKDEDAEFISFREKPSQIKAEELVAKGTSLWHSGITLASVSTILQELSIYSQETLKFASLSLQDSVGKRILTLKHEYSKNLKEAYFENSILENTSKISFTKILSPWINLGDIIAFKALPINLYEYETIENIDDEEFLHKSWGYYETIFEGKNHKVKRLFIKPFKTISLQSKFKAKDHWVVVSGFAKIICKNETMVLKQGQSFALSSQLKHTILNESEVPLEVIKTQVGDSVEESDDLGYQIFYGTA
jgi:mannose-6-phosphate isomerase-like protein (cupin superfamily)